MTAKNEKKGTELRGKAPCFYLYGEEGEKYFICILFWDKDEKHFDFSRKGLRRALQYARKQGFATKIRYRNVRRHLKKSAKWPVSFDLYSEEKEAKLILGGFKK